MAVNGRERPVRGGRPAQFRFGRYGCEDAVAWLLRANRLHGPDQRWASMTVFAAAFRGGSWPAPVSPSQISRWETAAARAGFGVLRRYEQLLGLPQGRLVAIADWVYRKASGRPGPSVLDRGLDPEDPRVQDRAGELFERALSADVMTGLDWDELTSELLAFPVAFVHPRTAWADLSERLLAELLITDGPAWLSRIEAVDRLLAHPRARPSIVAACAALAADPACQVGGKGRAGGDDRGTGARVGEQPVDRLDARQPGGPVGDQQLGEEPLAEVGPGGARVHE